MVDIQAVSSLIRWQAPFAVTCRVECLVGPEGRGRPAVGWGIAFQCPGFWLNEVFLPFLIGWAEAEGEGSAGKGGQPGLGSAFGLQQSVSSWW